MTVEPLLSHLTHIPVSVWKCCSPAGLRGSCPQWVCNGTERTLEEDAPPCYEDIELNYFARSSPSRLAKHVDDRIFISLLSIKTSLFSSSEKILLLLHDKPEHKTSTVLFHIWNDICPSHQGSSSVMFLFFPLHSVLLQSSQRSGKKTKTNKRNKTTLFSASYWEN